MSQSTQKNLQSGLLSVYDHRKTVIEVLSQHDLIGRVHFLSSNEEQAETQYIELRFNLAYRDKSDIFEPYKTVMLCVRFSKIDPSVLPVALLSHRSGSTYQYAEL